MLNLGGIANLTWLPPGGRAEDVIAFDVGPANALIDGVVRTLSGGRETFDRDGARAARGRPDAGLLARLLDDAFLRRRAAEIDRTRALRARRGGGPGPRMARGGPRRGRSGGDAGRLQRRGVRRACRDFLSPAGALARLFVGGGGAENPVLMAALARALAPARVEPMDAAGVPARACEAMAFALLGRNALLGRPNHLPRCTGAARAAVLGEIVPGARALPRATRSEPRAGPAVRRRPSRSRTGRGARSSRSRGA